MSACRSGTVPCPGRAPLPTYPRVDDREAITLIAKRALVVQTMSARCQVVITKPHGRATAGGDPLLGGDSAQFDGAVAARLPDHLRLRVWKFSRPVFDVTLTPGGLWLYTSERAGEPLPGDDAPLSGLTAERLARAWSLAAGRLAGGDWTPVATSSDRVLRVKGRLDASEGSVVCDIDRATLTPRLCSLRDAGNVTRMTLVLEEYRVLGDVVWPTRLVFQSDRGTVTVTLSDVAINTELAPEAFRPPRRATQVGAATQAGTAPQP